MNLEFSFEQILESLGNYPTKPAIQSFSELSVEPPSELSAQSSAQSSAQPSAQSSTQSLSDSSVGLSLRSSPIVFVQRELLGEKKIIHERAVTRAQRYLVAEAELLESIIEADKKKLFEDFGISHLTPYCVKQLGLSEDVAANFVRVARKTYEVPELKTAIDEGKLTVSKAKAITSVITPENQKTWINKAETLSKNKLEKEIAHSSPKPIKPEKSKYEGPNRVRYEFYLTEEESELFKRAQNLLCQKRRRQVSLAETQAELLKCFLDKHDPVRIAQRIQAKAEQLQSSSPKNSTHHPSQDWCEKKTAPELHQNGSLASALTSKSGSTSEPKSESKSSSRSEPNSKPNPAPNPESKWYRNSSSTKRTKLPASVIHAVSLRDRGRCQAQLSDGSICLETRWVHMHHITPKSEGGHDTPENLITLCSAHHRLWHAPQ